MPVEIYDEIAPLAREWDELADRANATPWLRPGWVAAWWDAFGQGKLQIVSLRRGGTLVGLVPLELRNGALYSTTNWHTPEFSLLAADDGARSELARALFRRGRRRVSLAFVNDDDPGLAACRAAADPAGYRLLERTLERSPYVPTGGDRDAYEQGLRRGLRKELRRRRRQLQAQGEVSFELEDGQTRLPELLDEGFRIEASGWKAESGTAITSRPETDRFYRTVAGWAAERGWLRLAFLRLDGVPFAFDFGVADEEAYSSLKGGFDPAYRRAGPGMLLTEDLIDHCFRAGLARYEFLGSEEPYKLEWTNLVHERKLLQGFARSAPGLADWAAFAYGRPVAKRVLALAGR